MCPLQLGNISVYDLGVYDLGSQGNLCLYHLLWPSLCWCPVCSGRLKVEHRNGCREICWIYQWVEGIQKLIDEEHPLWSNPSTKFCALSKADFIFIPQIIIIPSQALYLLVLMWILTIFWSTLTQQRLWSSWARQEDDIGGPAGSYRRHHWSSRLTSFSILIPQWVEIFCYLGKFPIALSLKKTSCQKNKKMKLWTFELKMRTPPTHPGDLRLSGKFTAFLSKIVKNS